MTVLGARIRCSVYSRVKAYAGKYGENELNWLN